MKKIVLRIIVLGLILITSSQKVLAATQENKRIIVKFKASITQATKNNFLKKNSLTKQTNILSNMEVVELRPGENLNTKIATLRSQKNIEFVEEDRLMAADNTANQYIPNDPYFTSQYYLSKIMAPETWYFQKATGVKVGVCDSGYESGHPDLSGVFISELGRNVVNSNNDWSPVANHGTLVAGIISALSNNGLGISGIAIGSKIIPIKITNRADSYSYYSDMALCIVYAADSGAKVINLSYNGARYSSAVDTAAGYAESKGAVVVVSAGNDAILENNPDFPNTISVSSTTSTDSLSNFSSYGTYVDIAAPGSSILTTNLGGSYAYVDGTSFSAPAVTAALALIFAQNPQYTPAQAKQVLFSSTDDIGPVGEDIYYGAGRLNIYNVIFRKLAPVQFSPFLGQSVSVARPALVWSNVYVGASSYQLQLSTDPNFTTLTFPQVTIPYRPTALGAKPLTNWFPPSDLVPGTKYYWRVRYVNSINIPSAWSTSNFNKI